MQNTGGTDGNLKGILSLISLTKKAGKSVSGEFAVEKAIKENRAKLIIIAGDASKNTKKKFYDMSTYRNLPMAVLADKERLGQALGMDLRASIAILDEGFATSISKKITCEEVDLWQK